MASHKRVDSAVGSTPMEPIIATEPNSGSQIEQVQVFLESARSLIAQEGSSLLHTLLDRVKHLEIELQDKNKIMDGCKHFNKELSVANSSLEAREKDNLTKFSEIMTECENLRSTNLQTEKELQAVLLEKQSSESKLEIVRQKLKAEKETTKQLRDTVNEKDGTLATRSAEVELLRKSEQTLIKHCKKADQDISQIQRFTTKLQDEDQDEMTKRMGALWQGVRGFVLDHLCKDIPLDVLNHEHALNELKAAVPNIPLPSSNSPPAKQMRFVAIVTVIINSMFNHLFQPSYIIGQGTDVQNVLVEQAEYDLNQERLCRSILLSMLQDATESYTQDRIDEVITDITNIVESLSIDADAFAIGLKNCVEHAYKMWDVTRKRRALYHLSFTRYHQDDLDLATIDLPAFTNDKVQQPVAVHGINDDVVLEVFPRVYVSEKPMKQLNAGIAVRRYQTLAAKKEYEEESFKAPIRGTVRLKPTSGRARRRSVALAGHSSTQR